MTVSVFVLQSYQSHYYLAVTPRTKYVDFNSMVWKIKQSNFLCENPGNTLIVKIVAQKGLKKYRFTLSFSLYFLLYLLKISFLQLFYPTHQPLFKGVITPIFWLEISNLHGESDLKKI